MDRNIIEFAQFIERTRKASGISRAELCEGIVSTRQYQRYLKGDSDISNSNLYEIADRLGVTTYYLYENFTKYIDTENRKIKAVYHLISERKNQEASTLLETIDYDQIVSKYNKDYYSYCNTSIQLKLKKISNEVALKQYSDIINYPNLLKKEVINWLEITVLIGISTLESAKKNYGTVNIIKDILEQKKYTLALAHEFLVMPALYSKLAGLYGLMDEFDSVISVTTQGIDYCIKAGLITSLAHLYIFRAIAQKDLGNIDKSLDDVRLSFKVLDIEGFKAKHENFKNVFEKEWDMKLEDLGC